MVKKIELTPEKDTDSTTEDLEEVIIKRIPDMSNEGLERVQVLLPKEQLDKLKKIAYKKEVSRGALIRESLRDWFAKMEKPIEANPEAKIPDKDLNAILDHCSTYFGGFEIDGENGFIEFMERNKLKLKDLTPEQWERVKEKLQIGYAGYISPPEPEEFAEKFDVLEPNKEQKKWFSTSEEIEEFEIV